MKKLFFLSLLIALSGCEKTTPVHHYQEIVIEPASGDPHAGLDLSAMHLPAQQQTNDPAMQQMLQNSAVKAPIAWDTPTGWQALPGEGMRLVTFNSEGKDPVSCTIVSLGGMAGGLDENINRWAKQIHIDLNEKKSQGLTLTAQTIELSGGMALSLIDFTQLQAQDEASTDSMIAAILNLEDISTIFIKMTGAKEAVIANREKFLSLCHSLRLDHE